MRKNSLFLALGITLVISGCSKQPEVVYVDLPEAESALALPPITLPAPPAGQTAASLTLPSQPSAEILLDTRPQLANVRKLIDQDRRHAHRSLVRQYSIERNADIDDLHQQKLAGITTVQAALREKATSQIRDRFNQYAGVRGPMLTKVSSLEAFQPFVRGSQAERTSLAAAASIRAQIATLDAEYFADRRNIQAQVRAGVDAELTRIARDIADLRGQADEEAEGAATRQLQAAHAPLPIPIAERVQLQPVGPRTMTVAGSAGPPSPPTPPQGLPVVSQAKNRELLLRQVRLWARTNGYVLQEQGRSGHNHTSEFIEWMRDRQLGR